MSLLNKFFGIKKQVPAVSNTSNNVTNDTVDQDGYVHLTGSGEPIHSLPGTDRSEFSDRTQFSDFIFYSPNPKVTIFSFSGPLPYSDIPNTSNYELDTSINKLYDEIPFEFCPAYSTKWSSNNYVKKQPRKLKEIDWDSLCYDFTLEKSIIQS